DQIDLPGDPWLAGSFLEWTDIEADNFRAITDEPEPVALDGRRGPHTGVWEIVRDVFLQPGRDIAVKFLAVSFAQADQDCRVWTAEIAVILITVGSDPNESARDHRRADEPRAGTHRPADVLRGRHITLSVFHLEREVERDAGLRAHGVA